MATVCYINTAGNLQQQQVVAVASGAGKSLMKQVFAEVVMFSLSIRKISVPFEISTHMRIAVFSLFWGNLCLDLELLLMTLKAIQYPSIPAERLKSGQEIIHIFSPQQRVEFQ